MRKKRNKKKSLKKNRNIPNSNAEFDSGSFLSLYLENKKKLIYIFKKKPNANENKLSEFFY